MPFSQKERALDSLSPGKGPIDTSKQPISTRYSGHVTSYQLIRDQYFLIRSVPVKNLYNDSQILVLITISKLINYYFTTPINNLLNWICGEQGSCQLEMKLYTALVEITPSLFCHCPDERDKTSLFAQYIHCLALIGAQLLDSELMAAINGCSELMAAGPIDTSKQPISTRYSGDVTSYQLIRDQYFLIRSVAVKNLYNDSRAIRLIRYTIGAKKTEPILIGQRLEYVGNPMQQQPEWGIERGLVGTENNHILISGIVF
eukprot:sb/3468492/